MFSPEVLDGLMERIISQLGLETGNLTKGIKASQANGGGDNQSNQVTIPHFSPQKVLTILGLLGGVLEVKYVLVDRDQIVNILLDGSLKRPSKLDDCLDQIGAMPFDDVLRAIMGRL